MKKDHLLSLVAGIVITGSVLVLFVFQPRFLTQFDYKVYDELLERNHSEKATDVPIIVDIDEKSLSELGQWPWPRYRVALLLGSLLKMKVAAVGMDIVFSEPDNTSLNVLKKQLARDLKVHASFQGVPKQLEDNDRIFASLLKSGPVVLGMDFLFGGAPKKKRCFAKDIPVSSLGGKGSVDVLEALHSAPDVLCPLPILAASSRSTGFITIASDSDGIFRRVPLLISWNEKVYPSLALATLMQATGKKSVIVKTSSLGVESIRIGATVIPVDKKGQMVINFRGKRNTFKYVSAVDVIKRRVDPAEMKGHIVFIGTSASGLHDIRPTPLDSNYPGVETHATIVDNILSKQFISNPDWGPALVLASILFVGLLTTVLITWARALFIIPPLLVIGLSIWFGSNYLFVQHGMYVSPLYSSICLVSTFVLLTVLKFWREEHAKKNIQGAFEHYLAPSVIKRIIDDPDSLSLEGQEKEITIQFSDIRSFTSLSEKLTPTQVTELLHDYMTPMTRIITTHSGTLDKFIGDAVMAFWNAPIDVDAHQQKALAAALEQLERLKELNPLFMEKFGFEVHIGIGLHCGLVRVGNMGSADLFDYTLIGDNVNLASRLEGLTKFYGQEIVVSQSVVEACEGLYVFQELDRVRVKGRDEPVTIYTVHTMEDAHGRQEELEAYKTALISYRDGRFESALERFREIRSRFRDHKLYELYEERCLTLVENPPQGEWDGVFTHKTK